MAGDTASTATSDEDRTDPEVDGRPGRVGIGLRLVLVGTALCVGVIWIARLGIDGPSIGGGLLFELLPPLLLLYLGARYLGTVRRQLRERGARAEGDEAEDDVDGNTD